MQVRNWVYAVVVSNLDVAVVAAAVVGNCVWLIVVRVFGMVMVVWAVLVDLVVEVVMAVPVAAAMASLAL
eukprot:12015241-Ditylum_brightwellii.AAC.1